MRFPRTHDLSLAESLGEHVPEYAIYPITWEPEQVFYQEMLKAEALAKSKLG